jgi:hypothetical protein
MTTDYNRIGDLYRRAKEQPWRLRVEEPSMMRLIGDVRGKKIVDMACGEGFCFQARARCAKLRSDQ